MGNSNGTNNKKSKGNKVVTIFNFECKNCNTKIGQLISNNVNEEKITCPKCGSSNVTYGTLLK